MEERLRICYLSFMFAPYVGGAEVQAEKQARQLQALGHNVLVVTLRHQRHWKRREVMDGLPLVRVGGLYRRDGRLRIGRLGHVPTDIAMFLTLWRLRQQFDLIHAFQLSPLAIMAALLGKLAHKPVIICIPSTGPGKAQWEDHEQGTALMADTLTNTDFLKVALEDWVVGADDLTLLSHLALGKIMLKFLRKSGAFYQILSTRSRAFLTSWGFRVEQMAHIPGGVDLEKFCPAPERRPDAARPERDIICVARLTPAKGVDVLLHAWGRMLRDLAEQPGHLKPRLLLAGEGVCRPQLERIAAELGIQESVEFLGLRTDIIDLLQRAWGFVLPSRWEGMPNALLEAMACGLPCVATRVSGSEDVLCDGHNGLLVEPEQPIPMALALRRLLEDASLAERLGQAARATVVRGYQLDMIIRQCLDLYYHLLQKEKKTLPFGAEEQAAYE